jgi:ribosomal protein S18 acetylase RimI-like enzyme
MSSEQAMTDTTIIRSSRPEDRLALHELVAAAGVFSVEEMACARELIDEAIARKEQPEDAGYHLLVAELPDEQGESSYLAGYILFGRVPFTRSSWDLYWLATHPDAQRRGVARMLVAAMEQEIKDRGGTHVRVETSGTEGYAAARTFYEQTGYAQMTRLPEFYKPGDDMYTFLKRL